MLPITPELFDASSSHAPIYRIKPKPPPAPQSRKPQLAPASSVAAARTAPPTQHCPCKSWLLWVPAALDKPLKGPERAVSSVRQSRGRVEVSFIRRRGARYQEHAHGPTVHPAPCVLVPHLALVLPAECCHWAWPRCRIWARPGLGELQGVQLSPSPTGASPQALQLPVLGSPSSLVCTVWEAWVLVLIPMPPARKARPGWRKPAPTDSPRSGHLGTLFYLRT